MGACSSTHFSGDLCRVGVDESNAIGWVYAIVCRGAVLQVEGQGIDDFAHLKPSLAACICHSREEKVAFNFYQGLGRLEFPVQPIAVAFT